MTEYRIFDCAACEKTWDVYGQLAPFGDAHVFVLDDLDCHRCPGCGGDAKDLNGRDPESLA